jgi:hypothetical protein
MLFALCLVMSHLKNFLLTFIPMAGMLIGLPLLGVWAAGRPLETYLEFPPQTRHVRHAAFAWPAFMLVLALTAGAMVPVIRRAVRSWAASPPAASRRGHPFPWWGWVGLAAGIAAWVLAWTRFPWMASMQAHTFTPLWLAYIVVVNAICHCCSGSCLLMRRPVFFLCLFPVSAVFWWFFEYLNRFAQNWYYVGEAFGPWAYFWYATLPFATVLPAVLSTRDLVRSFAWVQRAFGRMPPLPVPAGRWLPWTVLALAAAGLAGIGVRPSILFPLLWVAPLLIVTALCSLLGESHALQELYRSDWTGLASVVIGALVCGFFWEMWNAYSLAQWKYSIPYVHRFEVFAMPILGYAGYLPFGLECAVAAGLLESVLPRGGERPERARPFLLEI